MSKSEDVLRLSVLPDSCILAHIDADEALRLQATELTSATKPDTEKQLAVREIERVDRCSSNRRFSLYVMIGSAVCMRCKGRAWDDPRVGISLKHRLFIMHEVAHTIVLANEASDMIRLLKLPSVEGTLSKARRVLRSCRLRLGNLAIAASELLLSSKSIVLHHSTCK